MNATLCTYCRHLDVLDRYRRGVKSRCPLCKSELLRTAAGTTFLYSNEGAARPTRTSWARTWGGVAGVAVGLLAIVGIQRTFAPPSPVARDDVSEVHDGPRHADDVETITPVPKALALALAKKGIASFYVGDVKPASRPPRPYADRDPVPTPQTVDAPPPQPEPSKATASIDFWSSPQMTERELLAQLAQLREVGFQDRAPADIKPGARPPKNREELMQFIKLIGEKNAKKTDGFIVEAKAARPDLAGLPFALGDACRLGADAARELAEHSLAINRALAATFGRRNIAGSNSLSTSAEMHDLISFWHQYPSPGFRNSRSYSQLFLDGAPAIEQVLTGQQSALRQSMVQKLAPVDDPVTTKLLARRALFDVDASVRQAAVEALELRPTKDYTDILMSGFRYPWSPVARHAAEAVIALKRTDVVGQLEAMGAEPDPTGPVVSDEKTVVREAVRISHAKNCLLCHPPAGAAQADAERLGQDVAFPIGRIPIPGESFSPAYYNQSRRDEFFVRADISYLRQDFSVRFEVNNVAPWPKEQRFDILVRTRPATAAETSDRATVRILADTANGAALRFAIERLTAK